MEALQDLRRAVERRERAFDRRRPFFARQVVADLHAARAPGEFREARWLDDVIALALAEREQLSKSETGAPPALRPVIDACGGSGRGSRIHVCGKSALQPLEALVAEFVAPERRERVMVEAARRRASLRACAFGGGVIFTRLWRAA